MCECGHESTCHTKSGYSSENVCNCNAMMAEWTQDTGFITNSSLLPITSFSYGPLKTEGEQAKIHVGNLKCYGSSKVQQVKKSKPRKTAVNNVRIVNPSVDDSDDFLDAEALLSGPRKAACKFF